MLQQSMATSEEDSSTTHLESIDSADKAFQAAASYVKTFEHEWLIGLCLDPTGRLIEQHQVFLSRTCQPCPLEALDGLLDAALVCHPTSLVAVRYHTHPWRGPRTEGMQKLRAFRLRAKARGIILHDLVIGDSTGGIYSIRGNWMESRAVKPLSQGLGRRLAPVGPPRSSDQAPQYD